MDVHVPIEETEVFASFVSICDAVWDLVVKWPEIGRRTLGEQLIRSADSVGANLVEGDGRYSDAEALHFFIIARASARETRFWIRRARKRMLIEATTADALVDDVEGATKSLNGLINYRRRTKNKNIVREQLAPYLPHLSMISTILNA